MTNFVIRLLRVVNKRPGNLTVASVANQFTYSALHARANYIKICAYALWREKCSQRKTKFSLHCGLQLFLQFGCNDDLRYVPYFIFSWSGVSIYFLLP